MFCTICLVTYQPVLLTPGSSSDVLQMSTAETVASAWGALRTLVCIHSSSVRDNSAAGISDTARSGGGAAQAEAAAC